MKKTRKNRADILKDVNAKDNVSKGMDRLIHYSSLHFIPIEKKNESWAAEVLYFNKNHSRPFSEPGRLKQKKDLERAILDQPYFKKIIDPVKREAKYFSSDWKGNPIDVHLNRIIDARVEKIPNNLVVKAIDEYSKSNQWKENERIRSRAEARRLVNDFNDQLGWPRLKPTEDPFDWIKRITTPAQEGDQKNAARKDIPMDIVDSVKAQIVDDKDMALFNEYLWKDGVEIACELGIDYYMNVLNKFQELSEKNLNDIKLENRFAFRFYTSLTTGKPVLEPLQIDTVYTSDYTMPDLSDAIFWGKDSYIFFGDFVRQFGANRSVEELRVIFAKNKAHHGFDWDKCSVIQRNAAKIRVGYHEFESQDMEVYTKYEVNANERFDKAAWDYQPNEKGKALYKAEREERNYNVWRSFYYLPDLLFDGQASLNFEEQAKYIFDLRKVQDQQRYGDDEKYAKSTLVAYASDELSFHDIKQAYMPWINLLWLKAKNEMIKAHPHGLVWFRKFITQAIAVTDSAGKQAAEKVQDFIAQVQQSGDAIVDAMTDESGKIINEGKPFTTHESGHLESGLKNLEGMMLLYSMMKQALGISDTAEGLDPKPRQSFGGIKAAIQGTEYATYTIEKYYGKSVTMAGERLLDFIYTIVDEKNSPRLQEFQDVVGKANGMALEAIKDIPKHTLGLYVQNIITEEQKAFVDNMANQLAAAGAIDIATVYYISTVTNLKYAYAILRLETNHKEREKQKQVEELRAHELAMKDKDLQIEMAKIQAVAQGNFAVKEMQMKYEEHFIELENMLQQAGIMQVKDKIKENRIEENVVQKQLDNGVDA